MIHKTFSIFPCLTVNQPHSVVDFLLFVCQRVFKLPSWLQRLVHGVDLLLHNTLESFLVWFLAWKLEQIFEGNKNVFTMTSSLLKRVTLTFMDITALINHWM